MQKDAYTLILEAIEAGRLQARRPAGGKRAGRAAGRQSRTPVREALQRLETQSMLTRDGRSLIVASLDHNQLAELYAVRTELEGLAARLAARHATDEEVRVLRSMVAEDRALLGGDPARAEPGEQAVSQADPPGQPQPVSGPAAGPCASVDGADGHHLLRRRGAGRGGAGRT